MFRGRSTTGEAFSELKSTHLLPLRNLKSGLKSYFPVHANLYSSMHANLLPSPRARNIRNRPVIIHHVPPPENTHALRERLLGILASAVAPPLSPGGSSTALAISPRAGYSPGPTSPGVPEWAFEAIPGETASPRWSCPPLAAALLMQLGPQGIWQLLVHVAASHQKTLVDEVRVFVLGNGVDYGWEQFHGCKGLNEALHVRLELKKGV